MFKYKISKAICLAIVRGHEVVYELMEYDESNQLHVGLVTGMDHQELMEGVDSIGDVLAHHLIEKDTVLALTHLHGMYYVTVDNPTATVSKRIDDAIMGCDTYSICYNDGYIYIQGYRGNALTSLTYSIDRNSHISDLTNLTLVQDYINRFDLRGIHKGTQVFAAPIG